MARKTIFDLQNKDIIRLIVNALRSYRGQASLGIPIDERESWQALQEVAVYDNEDNTITFYSGKNIKLRIIRITGSSKEGK